MTKNHNKVILVGTFHETIELCELSDLTIIGIIDNIKTDNYLGYKILGTDNDAETLFKVYSNLPLIITPDQPETRKKIADKYKNIGFCIATVISSGAFISKSATIGEGVTIQKYVNVSSGVTIGDFVRINTMANIMHDSFIGEFTTIAPNAVILGNVRIGKLSYIGSNSTILPGISIGSNTIIGAGAVVTRNVPDGLTYIGNPAREILR